MCKDAEEVDTVKHGHGNECKAVVFIHNVLSVDQVTIESHVSEDEKAVYGPSEPANLFGGPFTTISLRSDVIHIDIRCNKPLEAIKSAERVSSNFNCNWKFRLHLNNI